MGASLSHKFGQIIGELLEVAIEPKLRQFAIANDLYLDKVGKRRARKGKKVTWSDDKGNKHDLDFVLERGGSEEKIGVPVAFIESAWRRYTRHSRNKAQEIQSAILPLARRYSFSSPFKGVVLAGEFTNGALIQLKSLNFGVLYFPYQTVVDAFKIANIDLSFGDETSEDEFRLKIDQFQLLEDRQSIANELLRLNSKEVDVFFDLLTKSVVRYIDRVIVLPLYGQESIASNVLDAIDFIIKFTGEESNAHSLKRFEIIIRYNNTDKIEGSFENKFDAIEFLKAYI